jgi:hypothetical protein
MFPYVRFYGFLLSLLHIQLFPKGAIIRGYETMEAVEWAMGYREPKTLLVCLAHGMNVCFQVLRPWGKS